MENITPIIAAEAPARHDAGVVVIPNVGGAGVATDVAEQVAAAIQHDRTCTLTIGEAQEFFRRKLRRPLSERTLQRYCQSGTIDAQIISHSRGREWLLNETSLVRFIETYPVSLPEQEATPPSPTPATVATAPVVTPSQPPVIPPVSPMSGPPPQTGDATDAIDAGDDFAEPNVGETRRLGDALIENARLTALLDGKEEVIATLKNHDGQLRSQLKEQTSLASKLSTDVVNIATKMLSTMLAIGTAGKPTSTLPPSDDDQSPRLVTPER